MKISFIYPLGSFLAGFVLMGFEILSSRIIAPLVGNSLYSWAAVISTTLLGLSFGAWKGGVLADNKNTEKKLITALLISALLIAIVPLLTFALGRIPPFAGIVTLSLIYALLLFFPSSFVLGMLQPLLLKAYASSYEDLGKTYGLLSMLWSMGSILGVITVGFVFISLLGVTTIILLLSGICYAYGVGLSWKYKISRSPLIWTAVTLLLIGTFVWRAKTNIRDNVVFDKDTPYYHLQVVDFVTPYFGSTRSLFLDYDMHSLETENLIPEMYMNIFPLFGKLTDHPKDILVIGGGAYTLPKELAEYYNTSVDVFEIDPEIPGVVKKYFGYDENKITTTVGEARILLRTTSRHYDIIFGDAYNSFISVPWHLTTKEYLELTKTRLKDGGIYAMGFIAIRKGENSALAQSMLATFKTVYPNSYVLSFSGNGAGASENPSNIILIGMNAPRENRLTEKELRKKLHTLGKYSFLASYVLDEQDTDYGGVPIFTDDYAPVESQLEGIALSYFKTYSAFVSYIFSQKKTFSAAVIHDKLVFTPQ